MYYSNLEQATIQWMYGLRYDTDTETAILHVDINVKMIGILNDLFMKMKEHITQTALECKFAEHDFFISETQKTFGFGKIADVSFKNGAIVSLGFRIINKNRNPEVRKTHQYKIAQTFMMLTKGLRYLMTREIDVLPALENQPVQLFEVETISYREMHGHALQGFVHHSLRSFLKEMGELPHDDARIYRDNFRIQVKKLFGYEAEAHLKFESDGGFLVQVPGNASDIGIFGDERSHPIEYGAEFESHNVDTAQQQIGLLVGLAMILNWYYKKHPGHGYMQ